LFEFYRKQKKASNESATFRERPKKIPILNLRHPMPYFSSFYIYLFIKNNISSIRCSFCCSCF